MRKRKRKRVYLDYAATCPIDPRVTEAMRPYFFDKVGNTMAIHSWGWRTDKAVEDARSKIADMVEADGEEIIFTGSATESNNLALKGVAEANEAKGRHIIISAVEHDCVLESAKWLGKKGYEVSRVGVDKNGLVDLDELKNLIGRETVLVSVMHANNEVGTIEDVAKIGGMCRQGGVVFHTDAAQSFGKEKIDVDKMNIDLLTASSHKIYGPTGAAILYVRQGVKLEPLLHGGGQEKGLRSSTTNVAAIVGMAKAAEILGSEGKRENERLAGLRDRLIEGILSGIRGTSLNGHRQKRLVNNVNISFGGIEGESLLLELDRYGVAVSTGSACSSNNLEPSHVLMAMGLGVERTHGSVRFSLGRWTKEEDIDYVFGVLTRAVKRLRKVSVIK